MSQRSRGAAAAGYARPGSPAPEPVIAAALVALMGAGSLVAAAGWSAGHAVQAALGAGSAALSLLLLIGTGWISLPVVVAISVPLPALYSSDALRIASAAPITAIVVAGWILGITVSDRRVRTGWLPVAATLSLAGSFLLATLFARHAVVSLRELANFGLLLLLLVAATDAFARDAGAWPRTVRLLVVLAAVCGVLAVLEMSGVIPGEFPRSDSALHRAALGFGQPNSLGLFFAIVVPFGVHALRTAKAGVSRLGAAVALACIIAGLIATFSRGSWLSVLAGSAVLLLAGEPRFALRVWLGTLIVAVVVDSASGGILRDTVARTIGDWTIEQRFALMAAGVLMFMAYPLTGTGPGGYAESLGEFGPLIPQLWDYLPTPHNAFIQLAAETGVIGLIAFLAFLFAILRGQFRRSRAHGAPVRGARREAAAEAPSLARATLWSIAALCAACMVAWPFSHGTGQAMMLVLAGAFATGTAEQVSLRRSRDDAPADTGGPATPGARI